MSQDESSKPAIDFTEPKKKQKHRKDKPWDTEDIDHWKIDTFTPEDNKHHLLEESSFATLFPQYREAYLKQFWPEIKQCLASHNVEGEINFVEGSMSVKTTRKTWDPYVILKARDMIKLLSRSVPFHQAKKVLDDGMYSDIIKIGGLVRNKEKFVKRRQRLLGPNGATLKAIELLTECYVLVQGQTVSVMGTVKGLKQVRRIVEDCFNNIHPVYHVKELMIKRELAKDPAMKEENWDKYLPQYKKKNIQTKKAKKPAVVVKKSKSKMESAFPPEQQLRKEDHLMETGEYFLSKKERATKQLEKQKEAQKDKSSAKRKEMDKAFIAPKKSAKPRLV